METELRCFSKVILDVSQTFSKVIAPNILRASDFFSTVLPMVNGSDWGCIVRVMETIILLVLVVFNFIQQRWMNWTGLGMHCARPGDYHTFILTRI